MSESNVIPFPVAKRDAEEHHKAVTVSVMRGMVGELKAMGCQDDGMVDDLRVIQQMVYAMLRRSAGKRHGLQDMMERVFVSLEKAANDRGG